MSDIKLIDVDPITHVVTMKMEPKKVKGMFKLMQIVILSLLTVPGKDVLHPSKGGGIPDLLNTNIDPSDSTELMAEVMQRVKKTEREVIDDQIGSNDSPEEKLREIQVISVKQGNNESEILLRIRIINQAGQATDVTV